MSEPQTEAGRALVEWVVNLREFVTSERVLSDSSAEYVAADIVVVEAEARSAERTRLRVAVTELLWQGQSDQDGTYNDAVRAVLALLSEGHGMSDIETRLAAVVEGTDDTLRAALTFLRKRLIGTPPDVDMEDFYFAGLLDEAEAAGRAALASPKGDELDVERLARTLEVIWRQKWETEPGRGTVVIFGAYAEDIAREYRALSDAP